MVGSILFMYKQIVNDLCRASPEVPRRAGWRTWGSVLALALALLAGGAVLMPNSARSTKTEVVCPAPRHAAFQRALHVRGEDGPQTMWSRAYEQKSTDTWGDGALVELRRCVAWQPRPGVVASPRDRVAQLECRGALLQMDGEAPTLPDRLALVDQARELLRSVEVIGQRCEDVERSLNFQRTQGTLGKKDSNVLEALSQWAGFEVEFRDAFDILDRSSTMLQQRVDAGDVEAEKAMHATPGLRTALRRCILRGSREARLLANRVMDSSAVQQVKNCHSAQLEGIECLALSDAEADTETANAFDRGLLLSEIAIASSSKPFFRGNPACCPACEHNSPDAEGHLAPNGIVQAEALLSRGFELAQDHGERTEKGVLRAIQLCKHAEHLAKTHAADVVVKWRFHSAAALASRVGRYRLAAGTLAKSISYHLKHGLQEDALEAADKALAIGPDPLASFQQARLRFHLWKFKCGDEVVAAARQLSAIPSSLLNAGDEKVRLALSKRLFALHEAVESPNMLKCLILGDVAHVFACTFGKLFYEREVHP